MSFLQQLKKQKDKLKETDTVVTCADGQRYLERKTDDGSAKIVCPPSTYGFVVDTKPDDVPAEVVQHLYIGSQDCATQTVLNKYDIKHVLSLGISVDTKDVNYKFVECLDLPDTDIKPVLADSLGFIHNAVTSKENILVHCNAGVSRTSMIVIGYLMLYRRMEFIDAYNLVKSKRPAIQPNTGFKQQLSMYKPGCLLE